jgi:thioredoxin 1
MNKSISIIALLLCVAAIKSEVIELNKENFNSTIHGSEYVLTMYYDPFNNLCKKFLPKYERMSGDLKNIVFTKLNGETHVDLADE